MPIKVMTDEALGLLEDIYQQINEYKIRTWKIEKTNLGDVFWYSASQYEGIACLKPSVFDDMLVLDIHPFDDNVLDDLITGIYLGRFVQMLTGHYYGEYGIDSITIY